MFGIFFCYIEYCVVIRIDNLYVLIFLFFIVRKRKIYFRFIYIIRLYFKVFKFCFCCNIEY